MPQRQWGGSIIEETTEPLEANLFYMSTVAGWRSRSTPLRARKKGRARPRLFKTCDLKRLAWLLRSSRREENKLPVTGSLAKQMPLTCYQPKASNCFFSDTIWAILQKYITSHYQWEPIAKKTYHLAFVLNQVWANDSKEWTKAELQNNMAYMTHEKLVSLTTCLFQLLEPIQKHPKQWGLKGYCPFAVVLYTNTACTTFSPTICQFVSF